MKTRKYQALPFNTNQRKRGGMSYALLLLLILLAPQIVKGQRAKPWSSTESYAPGSPVVVDPHGVTYLAQQEVPAGTSLSTSRTGSPSMPSPPTVAPPTSVPSVTPNTGTVPEPASESNLGSWPSGSGSGLVFQGSQSIGRMLCRRGLAQGRSPEGRSASQPAQRSRLCGLQAGMGKGKERSGGVEPTDCRGRGASEKAAGRDRIPGKEHLEQEGGNLPGAE